MQLRSDDPAALKEIIIQVKQRAAEQGVTIEDGTKSENSTEFSKRVKFMLLTIYDLKNNKLVSIFQTSCDKM